MEEMIDDVLQARIQNPLLTCSLTAAVQQAAVDTALVTGLPLLEVQRLSAGRFDQLWVSTCLVSHPCIHDPSYILMHLIQIVERGEITKNNSTIFLDGFDSFIRTTEGYALQHGWTA